MLPEPKHKRGYTKKEILSICKERKIHHKKFWKAFGVNTVGLSEDGKTTYYYQCDVERALYKLGCADGKFHMWD